MNDPSESLFPFPVVDGSTPVAPWVEFRPMGLEVLRAPEWNEYDATAEVLGHAFQVSRQRMPWWVGDFMVVGEDTFGERYSQAVEAFGEYKYGSVANYASVCRRVPLARRAEGLSFTAHSHVAKLSAQDQTRWLQKALANGWTSDELFEAINGHPPRKSAGSDEGEADDLETLVGRAQRALKKLMAQDTDLSWRAAYQDWIDLLDKRL